MKLGLAMEAAEIELQLKGYKKKRCVLMHVKKEKQNDTCTVSFCNTMICLSLHLSFPDCLLSLARLN